MKRVCDIRKLADLEALRAWARAHRTTVTYLGPTLDSKPLYGATRGATTRVAVGPDPDPHPQPLSWRSPLEELR